MSWSSTRVPTQIWTLKQLHCCTQCLNHKDIYMLCFYTPLAVKKDEKLRITKMVVSKCPCLTFSNVIIRCQNLIGSSHQLIVPSTLYVQKISKSPARGSLFNRRQNKDERPWKHSSHSGHTVNNNNSAEGLGNPSWKIQQLKVTKRAEAS